MNVPTPWASVEVRLTPAEPSSITDEQQVIELMEAVAYELALHPDIGGVEVRDATTGLVSPMSVIPGTENTVAQADHDLATVGGWLGTCNGLIVFTTPQGLESAGTTIEEIAQSYGLQAEVRAQVHTDDRWRDAWKEFYRPMMIGQDKLKIRPSWHPKAPDEHMAELVLDPGRAFGTGLHETTRLCLEAMAARVDAGLHFAKCLDLGCGSGILGLAALRLWPTTLRHCVFIDNDIEAVQATEENLAHNQIPSERAQARLASESELGQSCYDLVLANIRPSVLIPAAATIAASVTKRGTLVLSGILDEEANDVIAAYLSSGLSLVDQPSDGGWTALIWQRMP